MFKASLLLIVFVLVSCSSGGFKEREGARTFFKQGKYTEALAELQKSSEYQEPRTKLLLALEQGLIFHTEGKYPESIKAFDDAKQISKELFTVSVSKKAETTFLSEAMDNYYGEAYELSLIHFYLALNHYLVYQQNPDSKEARTSLFAARAEILQWDSLLNTMKGERMGQTVFKNDLLAKVFGAMIHEALDTRADDQIALQLYKDAQEVLFKNYNAYKTFNLSFSAFKKDYSKFPTMPLDEVKKNYVAETAYYRNLKNFLDSKILSFTKALRPGEFNQMAKQIGASETVIKAVEQRKGKNNVGVIIQNGMIPFKVPERYYFGLGKGAQDGEGAKAVAAVGASVVTMFAAEKLGLLPAPNNWNPSSAAIGLQVTAFAVDQVAISFELPKIESQASSGDLVLEVYDAKGIKLKEEPLYLINPLGDIAEEAVAEHAAWLYGRLGVRLAGKHLAAIASSYVTYKTLGGGSDQGDFFARNAAVLQYVGLSKAIEQTEKADTRYWSTLPQDIRLGDLNLPKGTYTFKLQLMDNGQIKESYDLGAVEVKNPEKKIFINFRTKG